MKDDARINRRLGFTLLVIEQVRHGAIQKKPPNDRQNDSADEQWRRTDSACRQAKAWGDCGVMSVSVVLKPGYDCRAELSRLSTCFAKMFGGGVGRGLLPVP